MFDRLRAIEEAPLSRTQLNQLLVLSHEAGVSPGAFSYYWCETPAHTYDVTGLDGYSPKWKGASSLEHDSSSKDRTSR